MKNMLFSSWIQKLLDQETELSSYNPYTNQKYLKVERINSLFVQNMAVFYSTLVGISCVFYVICRSLFYCLRHYEVSHYLRIYSFNLYFLEYLFLANVSDLTFLAVRNLQMLFYFSPGLLSLVIQSLFAALSGFLFILLFSLPLLYSSFYGKLSKYFLVNMFRMKGSRLYSVIRYFFKPFIYGCLHATLY